MFKSAVAIVVAVLLVLGGLVAGSTVDAAWYFRLIPFGIGVALGTLLVNRRERT